MARMYRYLTLDSPRVNAMDAALRAQRSPR